MVVTHRESQMYAAQQLKLSNNKTIEIVEIHDNNRIEINFYDEKSDTRTPICALSKKGLIVSENNQNAIFDLCDGLTGEIPNDLELEKVLQNVVQSAQQTEQSLNNLSQIVQSMIGTIFDEIKKNIATNISIPLNQIR